MLDYFVLGAHTLDNQYFFDNRYWFSGILSVVVLFDVVEITVAGMITSKRLVHGLLAVAWSATILSYAFFSAVARIVGH